MGLQTPVDIAFNALPPEVTSNPDLTAAFAAATLREIEAIREQAGDDVLFRLETVVGMVMVAPSPPADRSSVAKQQAGGLEQPAARAREGTRFRDQLCRGDMDHRGLVETESVELLVTLANELGQAWPPKPTSRVHRCAAYGSRRESMNSKLLVAPLCSGRIVQNDVPNDRCAGSSGGASA